MSFDLAQNFYRQESENYQNVIFLCCSDDKKYNLLTVDLHNQQKASMGS